MRSPAFVTAAFGWGKADIEADRSKVTEGCRNGSISDTRTGHRTLRERCIQRGRESNHCLIFVEVRKRSLEDTKKYN